MKRKILHVLVSGGIGDTILLTPCLRAWKLNFPGGRLIAHCTDTSVRDVLMHNPYVDSLRLVRDAPSSAYARKPESVKSGGYFVPIRYASLYPSVSYKVSASHIIAEMLGLRLDNERPEIFLTPNEVESARERLYGTRFPIALHTVGATTDNKNWFHDRWESTIREFSDHTFVQLGVPSEPPISGASDFRGMKLRDSIAILQCCKAFVGIDSSMAHAAAALQVPSVVLFGASTPEVWGHRQAINLYARTRCSPCIDILRFGRCPYERRCMHDITVDSLVRALRFKLGTLKEQRVTEIR